MTTEEALQQATTTILAEVDTRMAALETTLTASVTAAAQAAATSAAQSIAQTAASQISASVNAQISLNNAQMQQALTQAVANAQTNAANAAQQAAVSTAQVQAAQTAQTIVQQLAAGISAAVDERLARIDGMEAIQITTNTGIIDFIRKWLHKKLGDAPTPHYVTRKLALLFGKLITQETQERVSADAAQNTAINNHTHTKSQITDFPTIYVQDTEPTTGNDGDIWIEEPTP